MKKHHVIFIPGLDDKRRDYDYFINKWTRFGVIPHVYRMGWKDDEKKFEPKLKKLIKYIDYLDKDNNLISLVGNSAGGSAVLNAFIVRPNINAVVNSFGRIKTGKNVHPSLVWASRKSPAFKESVQIFEKNESKMTLNQRNKVLTLSPLWDEIVPRTTITLDGATNKALPTIEHSISCFLAFTVFSPIIFKFILKK